MAMKVLLGPAIVGLDAARHVLWLLSYHVNGEARHEDAASGSRR